MGGNFVRLQFTLHDTQQMTMTQLIATHEQQNPPIPNLAKLWFGSRLLTLDYSPDALERFSQSHLVGQYSVQAAILEVDHPVQTLDLVLLHGAEDDRGGLGAEGHGEDLTRFFVRV